MFVSMLLMRMKDNTAVFTSAGMPYPLIYRAATHTVEEVIMKGMPLGAFTDFPYEQKEFQLSAGDTIILMSDGYPEMFNNKQETLDYFPRKRDHPKSRSQISPGNYRPSCKGRRNMGKRKIAR